MTLEKVKAVYALALFMKTEVKISEFLKPRIGIENFFSFGNPFFKELLLDKKVHEDIVRDVFELSNSNIEFVRTNTMTSADRKAFSKVRNSFMGMPKVKIRLDLIHAHAIMVWFYDLIETKGFLGEYTCRINAILSNESIIQTAEKVFDAKIDCNVSPNEFFKIYKELIRHETSDPVVPVLNPNHALPTETMIAVRERVANTTEYLKVYEPLMCVLYEKEYSGGDVAKILKVSAESIIKYVNKFASDETKEIRETCMKAIRKKCNACHAGKYVEGVAKANILKWIDKDGKWIVDGETFDLVTNWEAANIDINSLTKASMPVPTSTMKVLKDNAETASKYLLNYLELIPMLRSAFGLKNNQICAIFDVTMPQLSAFIYKYIKRENMPAIEYKSEYSIKMASGEFPEELERFILEWECEHLKCTQTINPTPIYKAKINEPQLSMLEPLPEIEEPVMDSHITKKDIEEFNGNGNPIDPNFEKDPEKEPSAFVRESVKSASNELNAILEQEIINRFRDPERGKRVLEMLKAGLVGAGGGAPNLGIKAEDLKTLDELQEEQNARLNAFLESKRQEALKRLQPESVPETPSTAKAVEEAMKSILPEPAEPETPSPSENVYKRVGCVAINPFIPCSFGPTLPAKENPFVDHETVRQAMSGNQQSGFNYIPYGYAGPSPLPDIPANTTNYNNYNPQKEEYNMPVDERPYPPIGERFPRTPFPTNNNTVRYMGYKLIIPKRYFTNKESEELIREYYSTIDYYNSTPNEASNNSLRVGFRLGVIFNSMDKNEKEKILNFIEAIEEEYPDAFKLSDILKGGV